MEALLDVLAAVGIAAGLLTVVGLLCEERIKTYFAQRRLAVANEADKLATWQRELASEKLREEFARFENGEQYERERDIIGEGNRADLYG